MRPAVIMSSRLPPLAAVVPANAADCADVFIRNPLTPSAGILSIPRSIRYIPAPFPGMLLSAELRASHDVMSRIKLDPSILVPTIFFVIDSLATNPATLDATSIIFSGNLSADGTSVALKPIVPLRLSSLRLSI